MKTYKAELFLNKKHKLAESPFYNQATGILSWVDIVDGNLFMMDKDGNIQTVSFGQMTGAAVPVPCGGGYLVAATDGIYTYKDKAVEKTFDLADVYKPYQRSNDAKMDPEGRLVFGSIVYDSEHEHCGNLYSFDGERVSVIWENTRLSNGMAWNKRGDKFFFSDSDEKKVFVFDYDLKSGKVSNRKTLFEIEGGVPDGMCIDKDDNIYLAVWGGNRIECHDSTTGEQISRIDVPAVQVSSCCFYGSDDRLFITTAGENMSGEFDGCLFECRL